MFCSARDWSPGIELMIVKNVDIEGITSFVTDVLLLNPMARDVMFSDSSGESQRMIRSFRCIDDNFGGWVELKRSEGRKVDAESRGQ